MELSIDDVVRTLERATIGRDASNHKKNVVRLISQRIIPSASNRAISQTVDALFSYSTRGGIQDEDAESERAWGVLQLVLGGDRADSDNARTLVHIILGFLLKVGRFRMELARRLLVRLYHEVGGTFQQMWEVRFFLWYALFIQRSLYGIRMRQAKTPRSNKANLTPPLSSLSLRLYADLYAFQLLNNEAFIEKTRHCRGAKIRLSPLQDPHLRRDVPSTDQHGSEASQNPVGPVKMHWDELSRTNRHADLTRRWIAMFLEDANKPLVHSTVPFLEGFSEDQDVLCDGIRDEVLGLRCKAELERRRIQQEHAGLADALGGVQLA
ncbi:hypothetical protein NMY22_g5896 [Coprinellus aureogranulatus]|nr:hypothetical protein NMY22_g5896 [Coprinellus aureogranulatus]